MRVKNRQKRRDEGKGRRGENGGFSLVELIVVIAVMAILIGILAPNLMQYIDRAKKSQMIQEFDDLTRVMEMYVADRITTGRYDSPDVTESNQYHIYVNTGAGQELDKDVTKYFKEVYPKKIENYWGYIIMKDNRGNIENQIWFYNPEGTASTVTYRYDTSKPGEVTEQAYTPAPQETPTNP